MSLRRTHPESPCGTFANARYFPSWAHGEVIPNSREEQLAFTSFKNVTKATDQ